MTAARQLVKRQPNHKVLLIDLRGHCANATIAGPHTVAAAARDVAATVAHACGLDAPTPSEPTALLADGTAPLVLGHSFGGKVGLAYAAAREEPPIRTWLFDSNPTITTGAGGVAFKRQPSGAETEMGASVPALLGAFGSSRHLTA